MKKLNQIGYIFAETFIYLFAFVSNCYASSVFEKLFDKEIDPLEAGVLISCGLSILIVPKKYRAKLAGIVLAATMIYFMIIVLNISSDIELR